MANVEVVIIEWLNTFAGDYPALGDKPKSAPGTFCLVDRTGGPRESMVLDKAELLVEIYDKESRLDASEKANTIADRIIELEAYSDDITHAEVTSVVNLDDTIAQYHRYQIYCDVWIRR